MIADIRDAGPNELMRLETELRTVELVCTATNTIVSRGTAAGKPE